MKHVVLVLALAAFADDTPPFATVSPSDYAMTQIDTVPTKDEIVKLFGPAPVDDLRDLINGDGDFGVQLRAIAALPRFCTGNCTSGEPHDTIVSVLGSIDPADRTGTTILRLRAAIEALGAARSGLTSDVNRLVPFLDNASRDIRVATARALRDLCNTQAIVPLRVRYEQEQVPQVRLAISAALRDLGQCSP